MAIRLRNIPILVIGSVLIGAGGLYFFGNAGKNQSTGTSNGGQVEQIVRKTEQKEEADVNEIRTNEGNTNVVKQTLSGTYRCWSFNIEGSGAGSCRNPPQAPLILNSDGTYSVSREEGKQEVKDGKLILSQSKIRGPGTILEEGMQIRFEYEYNGKQYTVTYLKSEEQLHK